jgi:hypothetical protein
MFLNPWAMTAVIGVIAYYGLAWVLVGRDPKPGPIMAQYNPPRNLSPSMLRYVWREAFDDRTFWASVLSLVSKGLAKMTLEEDVAVLRPARNDQRQHELPEEERLVLQELTAHQRRKGMRITMLDGRTTLVVTRMAEALRKAAEFRWFRRNHDLVTAGTVISIAALCLTAMPHFASEWLTLGFSLAVMAPGAFYLVFLLLRIRDLYGAAHKKFDATVVRRAAVLLAFVLPCVCSIVLGSVVLGVTWGWQVLVVTSFLVILNLAFLHLMRAPTAEGQKLLDEIEGFRLFLRSVEQLPMNRPDAPGEDAGAYEKYLPYAVALEVEQAWADRFMALASTHPQPEPSMAAESFYLGMWNGKPVQIVYRPQPVRSGRPY